MIEPDADLGQEEHIAQVVHKLVFEYPSHETVIDRDELAKKLHLRAKLIEPGLRPIARQFAACNSETLIALVYPPGTNAPTMNTVETSIPDWKSLDTSGGAREVSWFNGEGQFCMRVGLYRQKLVSRNPWRNPRPTSREEPETQYAVTLPGPGTGPYGDPNLPAPPLRLGPEQMKAGPAGPEQRT